MRTLTNMLKDLSVEKSITTCFVGGDGRDKIPKSHWLFSGAIYCETGLRGGGRGIGDRDSWTNVLRRRVGENESALFSPKVYRRKSRLHMAPVFQCFYNL